MTLTEADIKPIVRVFTLQLRTTRARDFARAAAIIVAVRKVDGGPRPGHRRMVNDMLRERERMAVGYLTTRGLRRLRRKGWDPDPMVEVVPTTADGAQQWAIKIRAVPRVRVAPRPEQTPPEPKPCCAHPQLGGANHARTFHGVTA